MDWRDILERALWTAVQSGLATLTTVPLITDADGWESAAVAAGTAGLGAALSFIKTVAQERLGRWETRASMILGGHPDDPGPL